MLEKPVRKAAELLEKLPAEFEIKRQWTDEELAFVEQFTPSDWTLVDSAFLGRGSVRRQSDIRLAAKIRTRSYAISAQADELADRIDRIYRIFGWGPGPLDAELVEHAQSLSYAQAEILEVVPVSKKLSIPRVLFTALTSLRDIRDVVADIERLAPFGVVGPAREDTYLGVAWGEVVAELGL